MGVSFKTFCRGSAEGIGRTHDKIILDYVLRGNTDVFGSRMTAYELWEAFIPL